MILALSSWTVISAQQKRELESLNTEAGEFKIIELTKPTAIKLADKEMTLDSPVGYSFTLSGKTVFKVEDLPQSHPLFGLTPTVHTFFSQPLSATQRHQGIEVFASVIIIDWFANGCEPGSLQFIGIKRNGSCEISSEIIPCADHAITWEWNRITVTHSGNRRVPTETWVYEDGFLTKLKPGILRPKR